MKTSKSCTLKLLPFSLSLFLFLAVKTVAQPTITSFTPASGGRFTSITISGTNFINVSSVKFGGVNALTYAVLSPSTILARVDTGATGNITVQTSSGTASLAGFTFIPPPAITSFSPATGSIGTHVFIYGSKFTNATGVFFESVNAQSFTVLSDTVIDAIVGEGATGRIFVQTTGGTAIAPGFIHTGPSLSSYLPTAGPPGTTVTIKGKNFTGVNAVTFQGIAASSFNVLSDSVIEAVTAPGSYGIVKATSALGAGTLPGFNLPFIRSFSPVSGTYNSNDTIKGFNFTGATAVTFGNVPALSFSVLSDTVIAAKIGIGATGNVRVFNTYGNATSSSFFSFISQPPVITNYTPTSGSAGTLISINGNHLAGIQSVSIGGTQAASFSVLTDTTMTIIVGAGSSGNIQIFNPAGFATASPAFTFTGPQITSFLPATASPGDTIVISGNNFNNVSEVNFGGTPATFFNVISPSQIKAVVGNGSTGNVNVVALLGTATKLNFFMKPQLLFFTPVSTGKDSIVTIRGKFLTNPTAVKFGNINAASFAGVSDTVITAVVPANAESGNISVTVLGGGTAAIAGFTFVPAPQITSLNPLAGGMDTVISIFGNNLSGATEVKIGGVNAATFTIISPTLIKATADSGVSGIVTVRTPGGVSSFNGYQFYARPKIISFTPNSAGPMDLVEIRGTNLNGQKFNTPPSSTYPGYLSVKFGEKQKLRFHSISDTLIVVSPDSGATGQIYVQTTGGIDSVSGFTFIKVPVIQSFTPASGPVGTVVTITGTDFSPIPDSNIVYIGKVRSPVTSATSNSLTLSVPPGGIFDPISVTVKTKTAYSKSPFIVTFPGASAFSANSYSDRININIGSPIGFNVFLGDINGDGKLDMITDDRGAGRVAIFKNNSTSGIISFEPKVEIQGLSSPRVQAVQDIDGDGKPDILLIDNPSVSNNVGPVKIMKNISSVSTIAFTGPYYLSGCNNFGCLGAINSSLADLNKDGKPDLILLAGSSINNNPHLVVSYNLNSFSSLPFSLELQHFINGLGFGFNHLRAVATADFNNDGRLDILAGVEADHDSQRNIYIMQNLPGNGVVNSYDVSVFSNRLLQSGGKQSNVPPYAGDINFDGLPDVLATRNLISPAGSYYINNGNFSFTESAFYPSLASYQFIADMDGDGKPDLGRTKGDSFEVVRNKTIAGSNNITLTSKTSFYAGGRATGFAIGDLDGDGKPEIVIARYDDSTISILRNKTGESLVICPGGSTSLTSNITGSNYQWQLDTGSGFSNIADNITYTGAITNILQLNNMNDSTYGYRYRCQAGNAYSYIYTLKFENNWTGAVSSTWENPANWSCGSTPSNNTDVIINTGNAVISSNVTIRSLTVAAGASVTVTPGFTLTITH